MCKCKCRLDASVCNNKNVGMMINIGVNPKNELTKFECNKSCHVGAYLDYENCKCRKKLLDKLVEECKMKFEKC